MRITSKGQVTIPADIRERAGLLPHTEVDFHYDGDVVTVCFPSPLTGAASADCRRGPVHTESILVYLAIRWPGSKRF